MRHTLIIISLIIGTLSCATPGESLGEKNPTLYNEIIGTWYLLSSEEFGKSNYQITLKNDGTVSTNLDVMGLKKLIWIDPSLGGAGRFILIRSKERRGRNGITITYGNNVFSRSDALVESYYGDIYNRNNSIYKPYIPPLKELKIRIQSGRQVKEGFLVYTKDISILPKLKQKYENANK